MSQIKRLPSDVISRIAAGEIVVRPSAVVKELIENSLDARSSKIQIVIKKAGKDLIRIIDNGAGMSEEDALLSFERHTTSKIVHDADLDFLTTYGFRGEALASIASVSVIKMTTCENNSDFGIALSLEGGTQISLKPCTPIHGTQIDVQNLFFNVPARRKFLKNSQTEFSHIMNVVTHQALTALDVHFELEHNGKKVFSAKPVDCLFDRLKQIYGDSFSEDLFFVKDQESVIKLSGWVSKPSLSRANRTLQKVFVNGRYVTDKIVSMAIYQAYKNVLSPGRYSLCFLFLEVSPCFIDVNVHPSKEMIKFENEVLVRQIVYRSLKKALNQMAHSEKLPNQNIPDFFEKKESHVNPFVTSLSSKPIQSQSEGNKKSQSKKTLSENQKKDKFKAMRKSSFYSFYKDNVDKISESGEKFFPNEFHKLENEQVDSHYSETSLTESSSAVEILKKPFEQSVNKDGEKFFEKINPEDSLTNNLTDNKNSTQKRSKEIPDIVANNEDNAQKRCKKDVEEENNQEEESFFKTSFHSEEKKFYIFKNLFIITEDGDDLVFIDQHAAHERVLYEQFLKNSQEMSTCQDLLVPLALEVFPPDISLVEALCPSFEKLGFQIEPFGEKTFLIRGIPSFIRESSILTIIQDIIDDMREHGYKTEEALLVHFDEFLATMACRSAIKAGDIVEESKLRFIFKELEKCNNRNTCPHGRPTTIKISLNELNKKFRRIK